MTDKNTRDDAALEALFENARATPTDLPEGLMARVLQDAVAHQPTEATLRGWRFWVPLLGGTPGLSGLVAASALGVWLGVAPPDALPDVAGLLMGVEVLDETGSETESWTSFGWDLEES